MLADPLTRRSFNLYAIFFNLGAHQLRPGLQVVQIPINFLSFLWREEQFFGESLATDTAQYIASAINDRTALWTFWYHGV